MNTNGFEKLRIYIESIYDIPFKISVNKSVNDISYCIKPENDRKQLFDINVSYKNNIRLIIEVTPEKYAAFSIQDMGNASTDKKKMFVEYAKQLKERKASIDFSINEVSYDILNYESWPERWESYKIRISRSPVCDSEIFDQIEVSKTWVEIVIGMMLSLLNIIGCDQDEYYEGGIQRTECNKYERNPINRELCLAANGYTCKVCGFDFEKFYGDIGKKFIHVHHIVPVSTMKEARRINPIMDLIPVCPNCHAMLHRKDPPFLPEEIKRIIERRT